MTDQNTIEFLTATDQEIQRAWDRIEAVLVAQPETHVSVSANLPGFAAVWVKYFKLCGQGEMEAMLMGTLSMPGVVFMYMLLSTLVAQKKESVGVEELERMMCDKGDMQ